MSPPEVVYSPLGLASADVPKEEGKVERGLIMKIVPPSKKLAGKR